MFLLLISSVSRMLQLMSRRVGGVAGRKTFTSLPSPFFSLPFLNFDQLSSRRHRRSRRVAARGPKSRRFRDWDLCVLALVLQHRNLLYPRSSPNGASSGYPDSTEGVGGIDRPPYLPSPRRLADRMGRIDVLSILDALVAVAVLWTSGFLYQLDYGVFIKAPPWFRDPSGSSPATQPPTEGGGGAGGTGEGAGEGALSGQAPKSTSISDSNDPEYERLCLLGERGSLS